VPNPRCVTGRIRECQVWGDRRSSRLNIVAGMSYARGPTANEIRDINARYHDLAADSYDSKWGIDYGAIGEEQVLTKLAKALGTQPGHYRRALEIGAGTGYFSLNLLRAGVVEQSTATDISSGMLQQLDSTADRLGLVVETVCANAEQLPFEDESFDLVLGHAVLHHLPGLERALDEFQRVLVPGGRLAFMGEPSEYGDRLAATPKRLGTFAAPAWRRLFGLESRNGHDPDLDPHARQNGDAGLEFLVDVHVFSPGRLRELAFDAGFVDVRVTGEELLASAYGWLLRSLQAGSDPAQVPRAWHQFAFRSYLALRWLDGRLLEPRLPASLFYNLLLSARKPGGLSRNVRQETG
jgi:SAM-dependent methyltransferase